MATRSATSVDSSSQAIAVVWLALATVIGLLSSGGCAMHAGRAVVEEEVEGAAHDPGAILHDSAAMQSPTGQQLDLQQESSGASVAAEFACQEPTTVTEAFAALEAQPWSLRPVASQHPGFPRVANLPGPATMQEPIDWSSERPVTH